MKKIYPALPYSDPNPEARGLRFELANKMAAELMQEGNLVYSPISYSHPISLHMDNSNDGNFWLKNSLAFLPTCDELAIYCLPGWKKSKGVAVEIRVAKEHGMSIRYLKEDGSPAHPLYLKKGLKPKLWKG